MLQVVLLGPVEACVKSQVLTKGARPQERAVLAVLADRFGYSVSVNELLGEVWGADRSEQARGTLQCHVSRLRRRLNGIGNIIHSAGSYQLRCAQAEIDAHRFSGLVKTAASMAAPERIHILEQALRLWRGEPLQGLDVPYAIRRRDQLYRLRLRAVLQWSDAALAIGAAASVVEELESLWEANPLCEPLAARLMEGLYLTGYTADALGCFERLRKHLDEELGQLPGAAVSAIHVKILRGDFGPADLVASLDW